MYYNNNFKQLVYLEKVIGVVTDKAGRGVPLTQQLRAPDRGTQNGRRKKIHGNQVDGLLLSIVFSNATDHID
ncbi:hypothetical protein IF1G_09275 [Cordyceps javanica]|uniref:Uncharacterized protein n=1 Tax=Cordyceps javanica TaxID=43265 RepID=A0A545URY4_9HYPO|nr:hypothetical protein IF1G_09275 [Cordyceps javanica]TQW04010.1 hypothetical protein IF2G_08324 [Cordyceps javanica]